MPQREIIVSGYAEFEYNLICNFSHFNIFESLWWVIWMKNPKKALQLVYPTVKMDENIFNVCR